MKKGIIAAIVTLIILLVATASADIPLTAESWLDQSLVDADTLLVSKGYEKAESDATQHTIAYASYSQSPTVVYLYYDPSTLKVSMMAALYYEGSALPEIASTYSIIYGEPVITTGNSKDETIRTWIFDDYQIEISTSGPTDKPTAGGIIIQKADVSESASEPIATDIPSPTVEPPKEVAGSIKAPNIEFTFEHSQVLSDLRFNQLETGSLAMHLNKEYNGTDYIAMKCRVKNKLNKPIDLHPIDGYLMVDGNQYDINFFTAASGKIQPQQITLAYLYAIVPKTVIKSMKTYQFTIAFTEDLEYDFNAQNHFEQYPYRYTIIE